ncbi:MAG TPA: hypothetical protein VMU98_04400 [Acidimicrobiales bacterium]|nr:hypothetical protein [Acidimicrobiales bacterium]
MRAEESLTGNQEIAARRVVARTQTLFFVILFGCVLVSHSPVAQRDGISFYAVNARTIALAFVGYLVAAVGLWRLSQIFLAVNEERLVWSALRVVAIMLVVLLATPFNKGTFLNWAHMVAGAAGALAQLALGWRLGTRTREVKAWGALAAMLAGGVLAALSLPDWRFTALLEGEIILEIGFAWCVWEWTKVLAAVPAPTTSGRASARESPLRRGPSRR